MDIEQSQFRLGFGNGRKRLGLSALSTTVLLIVPLLSGCNVGPNYRPPEVQVLNEFGEQGREPTTRPANGIGSRTVSKSSPAIDWWRTFHDPELDSLIERAWDANLDVQRATERLREARAERGVVGADLFPKLNVDGTYEHARVSKNGIASAFGGSSSGGSSATTPPVNAGGSGSAAGSGGSAAIPGSSIGEFDLYQASFDATWELDIFGGRRRAVEAANAQIQAAVEDRRDVLVSVFGEVARNYLELRITQRRLEIARNNLAAQQKTLVLVNERATNGLSNQLDGNRQQALVATTAAEIPALEISIGEAIHRLSVLIDERPTALSSELVEIKPLAALPDEVPVGLPSDLLRRRADIRRAERKLAAATAQIGVSTADLYPKFNLVGSVGLQSTEPGHLLDYASRFYSIGPSISWPVFDAGRIHSQIKVAQSQQAQAMLDFKQAVLGALKEVDDALLNYSKQQERTRSLREAVEANERSVRIANEEYQSGVGNFIDVLDAQRELFSSQDSLATSEGQLDTSLVSLYKALGGGWEMDVLRELQNPNPETRDPNEIRMTKSE